MSKFQQKTNNVIFTYLLAYLLFWWRHKLVSITMLSPHVKISSKKSNNIIFYYIVTYLLISMGRGDATNDVTSWFWWRRRFYTCQKFHQKRTILYLLTCLLAYHYPPHNSETVRARKFRFYAHVHRAKYTFLVWIFSARGRVKGTGPPTIHMGPPSYLGNC